MSEDKSKFLERTLNSLHHPFYVIDVKDYKIIFANEASLVCAPHGCLKEATTCHLLTHRSPYPCKEEHICPLSEVVRTKQPVATEHVHYDSRGSRRIMEVHGDPVFDDKGDVVMMIEYAFDVTGHKNNQEELVLKVDKYEKLLKVMVGRERRIIELKKEVDEVLIAANKPPRYKV